MSISGDGAPSITVRRPTLIEGLSDDEHMPSFNSPSPSPDLPSDSHSPSGGQYRPKLETVSSQTHSPLLGDISAANTPTSPQDNPFDTYRMDGTSPAVSPAPVEGAGPPPMSSTSSSSPHEYEDYNEGPFRNNASASSSSGGSHDAEKVTAAGNRASLAPTEKSTATSTGRAAPLTAAERRMQRMSKITNKSKNNRMSNRPAGQQMSRKAFQSTRLKEEIYKPWLEKKDPAMRWARWITIGSIILGFAIMGVLCWDGYNSIPKLGKTCSVLDENWSGGLDTNRWTREVRTDGYGHGQFAWSTPFDNNSYVEDGVLYIVPHLTSDIIGEDAVSNGYTLNLTADGRCTSNNVSQCVAVSNSSQLTVINPVTTARLTTKNSASMKYGKVEIVAKMPLGDWLWPSVMMLPVDETYGAWPRSGEIDIITSRGNNASYPQRGVDYAQSSLHWGPTNDLDRLYLTWGYREQRRSAYNEKFHTYGLEWNENYMWTYIDSRVSQVISLRFNKQSFWQRGNFPATYTNHTSGDIVRLTNPWINSGNNVAPFDQKFYLAIDLAVGATDGWFPDGEGQKPWLDNSLSAMSDFWIARNKWWNNWSTDPKVRGFAIKSVKMSEVC